MKTLTKITVLAASLAAVGFSPLSAKPAKSDASDAHPRLRALMEKRAKVRAHVAERLGLSEEQKATLKARRTQTAEALKAIRGDATLTAEQKKAKARDTLQAARADLRGVLNADQQAKLDRVRKHLKKRFGQGRA